MSDLPDEAVVASAIQGDKEAFGMLYERYVGRIYNYVYYRTGDSREAEDLTERVFVRAMHHIRNYRDRGLPFAAWLFRIAHNLVANWHRDKKNSKEVLLEDHSLAHPTSPHPEFELLQAEEQDRLLKIIRSLSPDKQQLIILKFVEHLSNAEIGQIMGRSEGAIKSLYHRALLIIRDEFDGGEP